MNNNLYTEKKKFNAIDILIVLGIIIIVIGIIFRSSIISKFNDTAKHTPCEITFEAENVPNEVASLITDSSKIYWTDKNVFLGTLDFYEAKDGVIYVEKSNGSYDKVKNEDAKNITGVIRASAFSDNGCYINGTDFLAAGMEITISTPLAQFKATVTSVKFTPFPVAS